jgi:hypothetical protein
MGPPLSCTSPLLSKTSTGRSSLTGGLPCIVGFTPLPYQTHPTARSPPPEAAVACVGAGCPFVCGCRGSSIQLEYAAPVGPVETDLLATTGEELSEFVGLLALVQEFGNVRRQPGAAARRQAELLA